MISNAEQLSSVVGEVNNSPFVGVDTEADSLHCYFEKLCLLQISTAQGDYLIDPLAGFDLQPLLNALEQRCVILHGADFDLRMMRRAGAFAPAQIFDTMIAARLLGHEAFSLAALVKHYFGVEMVKGSQKADWSRRPLTPQMEEYARNDTHYLIGLAGKLREELREKERLHWQEQSCERALRQSLQVRERDPEDLWRIKGSSALRGRAAALLRELWLWRDKEAQRLDRPAFRVLRNDDLLMIAEAADQGQSWKLHYLRGVKKEMLLEAVRRGLATPEENWPRRNVHPRVPRDLAAEKRAQALRVVRDKSAARQGIDPSIIAPKHVVEAIARDDAKAAELLLPWQAELLGL